MPTNAEIKAAIDLIVRSPHNHILTGAVADILDDIVDNIGGPAATTIYTGDGTLSGNRVVDLNGHNLRFGELDGSVVFYINVADQSIHLTNLVGSALAIDNDADNVEIQYKDPNTSIYLGNGSSQITHTADTHTFNGQTFVAAMTGDAADTFAASIQASNPTGLGNGSTILVSGDPTSAFTSISASFNDGERIATIVANALSGSSTITHTADHNIFSVVQVFADNAAAVTGGLAVGTLYRTGDALKIVHV